MSDFNGIVHQIRELFGNKNGFIPLHAPVFAGNEKKYLDECINSTFVSSTGKFVNEFEKRTAEYTGSKRAIAAVNGTCALHLALLLAGVERDTEVITQPLTFIATANAISYCGANPVFLDIDNKTLGLSPIALKLWLSENVRMHHNSLTGKAEAINIKTSKRISACVPVHTFGHPCRIDEIVTLCNEFDIPVIEDAAESIGSIFKGKHTGIFGLIGVLSFNGNKVITTGGGGMLLFNNDELADKAKHLTTQAKIPHPWEFDHDYTGFNYRMPNINAALGLAQLENIEKYLESKRKIAEKYAVIFKNENIRFITEPENAKSNYWLNCIILKDKEERDSFLSITNDNSVMTRPAWKLMNELKMYSRCECGPLENAHFIAERLVNIPSSPMMK